VKQNALHRAIACMELQKLHMSRHEGCSLGHGTRRMVPPGTPRSRDLDPAWIKDIATHILRCSATSSMQYWDGTSPQNLAPCMAKSPRKIGTELGELTC
jgi:hypothetical protein